jgi:tetratricopeptide (TPR) repeat protein
LILALAAAVAAATPCPNLVTPDALVCRALTAQKSGDHEAAAQAFEEAAKASNDKDPKTARMYAAAGNLWIAANQPGKAALDLDRALALPGLEAEQRGEALLDRARAAEAQGDFKTARVRANEAAATVSDDPFYWYFSAALAIREGDGTTATRAIGKALTLAPSDPAILFEAGHVADFNGDDDAARSYWRRAADNDPNGPVGKAAAKAIEMLGVTPTVKAEAPPPKARPQKTQPQKTQPRS